MQTNPYQSPSIDVLGLRVDEPITLLTDILVSIVCFYAYHRLNKRSYSSQVYSYYKYFFPLMGIGTFLSAVTDHSFAYALGPYWKIPGWHSSIVAISLAGWGSIVYARKLIQPRYYKFFYWLNLVELIFLLIGSTITLSFYLVIGHSVYGLMIIVGGFQVYVYYRTRQKGTIHFLAAILWSALAAIIFIQQWAISIWFNHIDLGHVLMALSIWHIYRGVRSIIGDSDYGMNDKYVNLPN